ncbi:hypothetical protein O0L34_g6649 [Tuta absoluta]|nr:hypothetical protein O0L34_g6649 [Tuta absoluta]
MSRCFVPSCSNNSDDNPDLLFVPIPERIREEWCRQVKTEYFRHYLQYCCEEHLNQEDIKNYLKCKLMKDVPIMARTAQLLHITSAKPNETSKKCQKVLQDEDIHNDKSIKLDLQVNRQRLDRIALAGTATDKPSALQELLLNQDFPSKQSSVTCFVPCCKNAAITCSDKQFFHVPLETRVEWCAAVGKHNISKGSIHICEDHINVKEDLLNYQDWKDHNVTPRLKLEVPKTLRIVSTSSKDHGSLTSMDKEKTETEMSKRRSITSTAPSSSVGDDDDDEDGNSNDNSDDSDKSLDDSDDNDSNNSDGDLNDDDDDVPMQSLDKCNIDNPLENDFGCQCSNCKEDIIGFRYTCVQCEDFDLCEACETQRVHDTHYILRIPTLRPQAEVNKIVSCVREAVTRALYRPGLPVDVPEPEIKTEFIEEIEDPLEEHPNSRPHKSNILEQSIVDIPLKTEESMDSDTVTPEHPDACNIQNSSVDRDTESTNNPIETKINSDNQPESSECNVQAKWPREVTSKSSAVQDKVPPGKKQVKSVCGNDATQSQLSNSQRAEIADLYQQKKSLSEIARRLKITRKAARLWTRRYVAEGHVFRRRPGSAPTAFTDASERHREIVATFTADPFMSTHSLAARHGVSLQTVRLHLKAAGFKSN